jgi:hypothetical protein
MANTTFNGPVRSENGFENITINSSTGTVTTGPAFGIAGVVVAPVALANANTTLTAAANAGRVNFTPDVTADRTYTLPAPTAGLYFQFVYSGLAADGHDFIIDTGSDTNYFIGNVAFNDTDDGAASVVFPDGNSNSKLQVNLPASAVINVLAKDSTNWYVWGSVTGATAPAFADQ